MSRDILSLDVGTTTFKLAVFESDLTPKCEVERTYEARLYDEGKADLDPEIWWQALRDCCADAGAALSDVGVVSLSVTTPGLTPMDAEGRALAPAVLFFDARSGRQAATIRQLVGESRLLEDTCNLPVSGGSSLASILWFRDECPDVWRSTVKFGHTNTYMAKRMTGRWAIDPSSTSITSLYNTARNDLTWNRTVLDAVGLPEDRLPPLMQSYDPVGPILPAVARELGLPSDAVILCGGNDAVLGSLSAGLKRRGQVGLVSGTCDIASVCIDEPVASPHFNIRSHILPGRWLTFFVLNTGGKALEWYRNVFCRELTADEFYRSYVPDALARYLGPGGEVESRLPVYEPYLAGSRYSIERLTAAFNGVTLETRREDFLVSLVRGNAMYVGAHLAEVAKLIPLEKTVMASGGGSSIDGMLEARRRWTGDFDFRFHGQSSLLGAAMLGQAYQAGDVGVLWGNSDQVDEMARQRAAGPDTARM